MSDFGIFRGFSVKLFEGQTPIDLGLIGSYSVGDYLLDTYPGAAAAYSLRQLSSTYSGDSIRVRRASDNAESDIGFVSGQLDTSTLEAFCSGTDGFVTTWYDQSGNGYNATQTTASYQPQIVSGGSTITENGKPCVKFDGSNDNFLSSVYLNSSFSGFAVATSNQIDSCDILRGGSSTAFLAGSANPFDLDYRFRTNSSSVSYYSMDLLQHLHTWINDTSTSYAAIDGDTFISASDTAINQPSIYIGGHFTPDFSLDQFMWKGTMQEIILYSSDQSSNRSGIETNINSQYQIYWDGSQTSLLDTYGGSAAAYSLRALSSSYTGALIKVRRASDNAEQDIYAKYDGTLNTDALESFCSGTDGYVTTWYDQSGNGYDATQSTSANQPQIVSSGSTITENGNPAIYGDGVNDLLNTNITLSVSGDITFDFFGVDRLISRDVFKSSISISPQNYSADRRMIVGICNESSNNTIRLSGGAIVYNEIITSYRLFNMNYQGGGGVIDSRINNVNLTTSTINNNGLNIQTNSQVVLFGNIGSSTIVSETYLQESIFYFSDQSSNRTNIESNINNFYNIY